MHVGLLCPASVPDAGYLLVVAHALTELQAIGGIASCAVQAKEALARLKRGGLLSGVQLLGLVSLLSGMQRMQHGIVAVARRANQLLPDQALWPLVSRVKVCACPELAQGLSLPVPVTCLPL